MTNYVGLDVSQKLTTICIVDDTGAGCGGVNARRTLNKLSGRCVGMPERMSASASKPVR
jgi:hypothetical protein